MKKLLILSLLLVACSNSIDYDSAEHLEHCPSSPYGQAASHDWINGVVLDDGSCTYRCKNCGRSKILDDSDVACYSSAYNSTRSIYYDYIHNKMVEK